jgi:hypothetical protein
MSSLTIFLVGVVVTAIVMVQDRGWQGPRGPSFRSTLMALLQLLGVMEAGTAA